MPGLKHSTPVSSDSRSSRITEEACNDVVRRLSTVYSWRSLAFTVRHADGHVVRGSSQDDRKAYPIGCAAKAYTAWLLTAVFKRRGLSLDSPVVEVIPEFANTARAHARAVTFRHLLSHKSGIDLEGLVRFPVRETEFWERVARAGALFAPGEHVSYCSPGFMIAACALERLTGRQFEELLVQLDLAESQLVPVQGESGRARREGTICVDAALGADFRSSTEALSLFGTRILGPECADFRSTVLWADDDVGFCICGTVNDVYTRLQIVPDAGLVIAAQVNAGESSVLHELFRELIGSCWSGIIKPAATPLVANVRTQLPGRYCCACFAIEVKASSGGKLSGIVSIDMEGEEWGEWCGKELEVDLQVGASGVMTGGIPFGRRGSYRFILEPLECHRGVEYLIFNRKMLIRRVS